MIARVPGRYRGVFPLGTGSPATVNGVGLEVRCAPGIDGGGRALPRRAKFVGPPRVSPEAEVPRLATAIESGLRMKVQWDGVPKTSR
jgi:hypothetical protein